MSVEIIYLDEDHEFEYDLSRRAPTTRVKETADGLTSINCWLSATEGGTTIAAGVSVAATEASAKLGTQYGTFDKADIATNLTAGGTYWRVLDKAGDFRVSTKLLAKQTRQV